MAFPHLGWDGPPIHWADHLQSRKDGLLLCFGMNIQLVPALCLCAAQPSWALSLHPNSCSVSLLAVLWVQNLWGEDFPKLNLPSYMEESPGQSLFPGRGRWEAAPPRVQDIQESTGENSIWGVIPSRKKNVFHIKFTWKKINKTWKNMWPL